MNNLIVRRFLQLGGLFLIADAAMGLLRPRWNSLLCRLGPELLRAVSEELADHPKTARTVYLAEAAVGIAVASLLPSEAD